MLRLFRYLSYLRFSAMSYVLMVFITLALAIELAFSPGLLKLLFDRLLASMDPLLLGKYLALNVFLLAYFMILFVLLGLFEEKATVQISNKIKLQILQRLFYTDHAFFLKNDTGFFMKRMMEDTHSVAVALSKMVVIFCNVLLIISICFIFFHMEAFLFYVYLFLLIFSVFWGLIWVYPAHIFNVKIGMGYSRIYSHLSEIIGGIKEIKLNTLDSIVLGRFRRSAHTLKLHFVANMAFGTMIWQLAFFFPLTAYGLILGLGIAKVKEGAITTGLLLGALQCVWIIFNPVQQIIASISFVQLGVTAASRLQALFQAPAEPSGPRSVHAFHRHIDFKGVSFQYPDGSSLFADLNMRIAKGQKIALVGPSGSGKSTLIKLLLKLTDGYTGSIAIDENELADLDTIHYRKLFTVISQENFIFHDTLRNNIDWHQRCSDSEISAILNKVQLGAFVHSLDNGLDSLVGGDKSKMSGGEKQRLAIARCLANPSPIIVLDEITASLDPAMEALVLKELDAFMRDKTVIIISHRIAALLNCDRIFVLNNGQVQEQGTHEELLSLGGVYCELFREHEKGTES